MLCCPGAEPKIGLSARAPYNSRLEPLDVQGLQFVSLMAFLNVVLFRLLRPVNQASVELAMAVFNEQAGLFHSMAAGPHVRGYTCE